MTTIYFSNVQLDGHEILIAAKESALVYVGSFIHGEEDLKRWSARHYPGFQLIRDDERMHPYHEQLREYGEGTRQHFTFPIDCQHGTAFQREVWNALLQIPYGSTTSYMNIAEKIGRTTAVRAVANAIGKNSLTIVIPCHRVVGKNGKLTGFAGGLEMKRYLLGKEENGMVVFNTETV